MAAPKVVFPKGEPLQKSYLPPYSGLVKACYENNMRIIYTRWDGKVMKAHTLTWADYDGLLEPEKAQYVFDGVNLGMEKAAIPLIMKQEIAPPDFIQVIYPWAQYPSDMQHYAPESMSELEKHFESKGVRMEYHEEWYSDYPEPASEKPAKHAPGK